MIHTRGIIEDVEWRRLKHGHEYAVVRIDGQQYEVWDSRLYDRLLEGMEVEYRFRRTADGDLRISDIKSPEERAARHDIDDWPYPPTQPADLATRYAALRLAIDTVGDGIQDPDEKADKAVEIAQKYCAYFEEGE